MPRLLAGIAVFALLASACSTDEGASEEVEGFQAELSCEALANRWVDSQQLFLDDIGDLPTADYDPPAPSVSRAKQRLGSAAIEQARDAELAGCAAELKPGSAVLCSGVVRLESRGPSGDIFLATLQQACE